MGFQPTRAGVTRVIPTVGHTVACDPCRESMADEPTGSWLPLDAKLPFVHAAGCLAWPSVEAGVLGAV